MKKFSVKLNLQPEQYLQLRKLQLSFVDVCNAIIPTVKQNQCWNRVALHHMVYHHMRERFPHIGSQMICNAIYSVCRVAKQLFQNPDSLWYLKSDETRFPRIVFKPDFPVFLDRHTLNFKGDQVSIYTLNGRMRFDLNLSQRNICQFKDEKLVEIRLVHDASEYSLHFYFAEEGTSEKVFKDNLLSNQVAISRNNETTKKLLSKSEKAYL